MDTPTAPTDTLTGLSNLKRAGSTPTMGRGKKLLVGIITHVYFIILKVYNYIMCLKYRISAGIFNSW